VFLSFDHAPKNTSQISELKYFPLLLLRLFGIPMVASEEFPMLDEGVEMNGWSGLLCGSDYEKSEVRFPGYYDGKRFYFRLDAEIGFSRSV